MNGNGLIFLGLAGFLAFVYWRRAAAASGSSPAAKDKGSTINIGQLGSNISLEPGLAGTSTGGVKDPTRPTNAGGSAGASDAVGSAAGYDSSGGKSQYTP
jgi:hypothetical protein